MAVHKKTYTVGEFEAFAEGDSDRLLELIHGEIVEKVPTEQHGMIALKVGSRILVFVEARNLGRVGVEIRHRVPGDNRNSRLPDISFTSDLKRPLVKKGSVQRMPDLAIEIKSPDDDWNDLIEKAEYYLQNGSQLVWLMNPENETVSVCRVGEDGSLQIQVANADDTLDGGDVLPGFTLAVRDMFPT
jgi:Uma2 family endonuclease